MGPKAIKEWKDSLKLTDGTESKPKPVKTYDVCITIVKYGMTVNGTKQPAMVSENFYTNLAKDSFDSDIPELAESAYGDGQAVKTGIDPPLSASQRPRGYIW